jgi:hypothetical protein
MILWDLRFSQGATMKNVIIWVVTPCSSGRVLRFGETYRLHFQSRRVTTQKILRFIIKRGKVVKDSRIEFQQNLLKYLWGTWKSQFMIILVKPPI